MEKKYMPDLPNVYKSKKQAQEAHEAIRPTSVNRTPESLNHLLTEDQYKLYSLIWSKFVASQMMPAIMKQTSVDIKAGEYHLRTSGSVMVFDGFLRAMDDQDPTKTKLLPELHKGENLTLVKLDENQHFTKPPPRFTEASLVKTLEEKGIGRPSTYAPIIQTIVERTYVERIGGSLIPTEMGFLVVDLLIKHFPKLMEVGFTARMEERLDEIEDGQVEWRDVLSSFYSGFSEKVIEAQSAVQNMKKFEQETDEKCEECGRPMVIKWGRRGKFMSCSGFPNCRVAKSIPTKVSCPECKAGKLVERRARSGRGRKFYGCTEYPKCTFIVNKLPTEQAQDPSNPPPSASSPPAEGQAG